MKLNSVFVLVLLLALINIAAGKGELLDPTTVQAGAGKVNGSLNIGDQHIELKHAYAIKTRIGFMVLLTDDAIPKNTLQSLKQSLDRRLLKDIWGIFFTLDSSGKEGLFTMQYGSGFTGRGTDELAVLKWKTEKGRVIGEAKYPKDGDKSEKSFAVSFDAAIED